MTTDTRPENRVAAAIVPRGSVVVGLDEPTFSTPILDWAADQAVLQHGPLVLVHALDLEGTRATDRADCAQLLAGARDHVRRHAGPTLEVHLHAEHSDPRELLVALSSQASIVVLGSHGRGALRSVVLGSVSVAVAKRAVCPVVVHRPSAHPGLVRRGVAVGTSATGRSSRTLEFAFASASLRDWPLTVIHAVCDAEAMVSTPHLVTGAALGRLEDERLQLAEAMAGLAEDHPDVRTRVLVARGRPEDCLTILGERMNLLVVERNASRHPLSRATAIAVLETADCPVAVVPASACERTKT